MFLQRILFRNELGVVRGLHTTPEVYGDKYALRQAKMLKKMMTGSSRSRKKFFTVDQTPSRQFKELEFLESKAPGTPRKLSHKVQKRVKVLNVLFVEQITSLLSTGEVGEDIISEGLAITQVKVVPDFTHVKVYWQPSGTEKDDILEAKLGRVAGLLRHQLSQLRVIGIVPPIRFVKDPLHAKVAEVEAALSKCDFGPDFEPAGVGALKSPLVGGHPKYETVKTTSKSEKVEADDANSSTEEASSDSDENEFLTDDVDKILNGSPMRQDILGLDRAAIMSKVRAAIERHQSKSSDTSVTYDSWEDSPHQKDDGTRTKDFLKYLQKQRRAKARDQARNSAAANDREFARLERIERFQMQQACIESDSIGHEDEDYIEEEFDSSSPSHNIYR